MGTRKAKLADYVIVVCVVAEDLEFDHLFYRSTETQKHIFDVSLYILSPDMVKQSQYRDYMLSADIHCISSLYYSDQNAIAEAKSNPFHLLVPVIQSALARQAL